MFVWHALHARKIQPMCQACLFSMHCMFGTLTQNIERIFISHTLHTRNIQPMFKSGLFNMYYIATINIYPMFKECVFQYALHIYIQTTLKECLFSMHFILESFLKIVQSKYFYYELYFWNTTFKEYLFNMQYIL